MQISNGKISLAPSDVTAYLACQHLAALNVRVARSELVPPPFKNDQAELIFRKGREHEEAYLQRLKDEGKRVVEISLEDGDWERGICETEQAMRTGPDVVYQATLVGDGWRGVADFLLRVDTPSKLGSWSYEALDTKLARTAKPYFLLQLAFYSEQVGRIQGRLPERMHVVLGTRERVSYRVREAPLKSAEAQGWAKAEMLRRSRAFVTAVGITRGSPDMVVGSKLTFERAGKPFDGAGYYATSVKHTYDLKNGHRTHFVAERATIQEGA
jgi:uncharacterized protein